MAGLDRDPRLIDLFIRTSRSRDFVHRVLGAEDEHADELWRGRAGGVWVRCRTFFLTDDSILDEVLIGAERAEHVLYPDGRWEWRGRSRGFDRLLDTLTGRGEQNGVTAGGVRTGRFQITVPNQAVRPRSEKNGGEGDDG